MNAAFSRIGAFPIAGMTITCMVVLTLWSRNLFRLGWESVWPTLTIAVLAAGIITFVLKLTTRSWEKAGIASGFAALYFFYVPLLLHSLGLARVPTGVLHILVITLMVLVLRRLPADREALRSLTGRLNVICLVVFAITALPLAVRAVQIENDRARPAQVFSDLGGKAGSESPDVWHILFDRYAANSTLKTRYGYDNTPFLDALRKRGFAVNEDAFSNYQRTGHSVASTMNGALLDDLAGRMQKNPTDWVPIYRSMRDGAVIRQFNRMDYRTIFAGSWWEPTRFSTTADTSIQIRALPQLARLLIDQSAVTFWLRGSRLPWLSGRTDQCFRAKEKFRLLGDLAGQDGRKMVFAHFLVPHPPFVLAADGSCRELDAAVKASRRDNYVAQIRFANVNALRLVDKILAGPRPAVIVLHSDEGPWPEPYVGNEHGLGTDPVPVPWADLSPEQLHEKFAILLAVREPNGMPPATMPSSPVQIYPSILRDHFGATMPLPPSRHQVFVSDAAIYTFEDVGNRLAAK